MHERADSGGGDVGVLVEVEPRREQHVRVEPATPPTVEVVRQPVATASESGSCSAQDRTGGARPDRRLPPWRTIVGSAPRTAVVKVGVSRSRPSLAGRGSPMNVRTPVFVYADDPVSQAGLEQLLRGRPEIHVVASGQIDDAQRGRRRRRGGRRRRGPDDRRASSATVARAWSSSRRSSTRRACSRRARPARSACCAGATRRRSASATVVAHVAAGEASVPTDLVGQLLGAVRRHAARRVAGAVRRAGVAVDARAGGPPAARRGPATRRRSPRRCATRSAP